MAPLPKPESSTIRAIYQAYERAAEYYDTLGISVGSANQECDRALWYAFRWISKREPSSGRMLSIFQTGDAWEDRLIADLELIGVTVWGNQDKIRLAGGHIRGKCDGHGIGIPEAPKTEHLLEFKSAKNTDFNQIVKNGCKEAKPLHYGQVQLGMHAFGHARALYMVVNKDSDHRYAERIKYDADFCIRLIARIERIISMPEPPARISEDSENFACRFCDHKPVCHNKAWPRVTCRSCLHSTPEMTGGEDAHWSCSRFSKPLSVDEQKAGCPTHLHIPALVPGELIDSDEEEETVTYRLEGGDTWVDGHTTTHHNGDHNDFAGTAT